MTDNKKSTKLIILDCDGVLYDESELDINAPVRALKTTCQEYFNFPDKNVDTVTKHTKDKPVSGIYNYIKDISEKLGITPETFVEKVVARVDYSHIIADKDNILEKLKELQHKHKICICSNNHLIHVNHVLKAKFNIQTNHFPFEIFDMTYAEKNGIFYSKESEVFVSKLEKHFNIQATNFLWIDDSPHVLDTVKSYGCQTMLVTPKNRLVDILNALQRTVL